MTKAYRSSAAGLVLLALGAFGAQAADPESC
jgi:hypothetical protein